jgi:tripartite-type tricarboxylate transporter receptor subunit TctC
MRLPRRRLLGLAAAAAALPFMSHRAIADTYPNRPVRIVVGFPPGGTGDITARLMGRWLSERLGQPFIIENRPGAASNIAAETVVRAMPDGHTLLWVTSSNAISASVYEKLTFNFIRDIAPVASVIRAPFVMEVNPSLPVKSVPEFVAYARANPGKVTFASGGQGSSTHLPGELFKMMAGVDMVHVPYRGSGSALANLISGHVQVAFDVISSSVEYVRTGQLRALAVTTTDRSPALPDIPTVGDFVPGYEASTWNGIGAPRNTPAEIVAKLNLEINAALTDPAIKVRFADQGGTAFPNSPATFGKFMAEETERLAKVVRFAAIKPE